jgi:hypothetical protein
MGHETFYCFRCSLRVGGADFDKGKAFRIDDKVVCDKCLTPEERAAAFAPPPSRGKPTTRIRMPKPGPGTSTRIPAPRLEAPKPSSAPLYMALAGGALLLLVGGLWLMSGSGPVEKPETVVRPPGPAPRPIEPDPTSEKSEDPQLREARAALEAARAKARSAPADLEGQLAAWEEAARKAALTPFFRRPPPDSRRSRIGSRRSSPSSLRDPS